MDTYEIYLITNKINNKKYVGQTTSRKGYLKRFDAHISESISVFDSVKKEKHSKTLLHKAIKKYGVENFEIILIEKDIPKDKIDERECYWISYYDSYYVNGKGYNMTYGGQGTRGYVFTEEDIKSISSGAKRFWVDLKQNHKDSYDDWCKHLSDINSGRVRSSATKQKLSDLAKKRVGCLNSFYGKHHTDDTKRMIGEANSKKIGMFDQDNNLLREFSSIYEATTYLINEGITKNKDASSRISKICRGLGKTAYGFVWRFL